MQEDKQSKMRPLERAVRKKNLGVLALLSLPFLVALFFDFPRCGQQAERKQWKSTVVHTGRAGTAD